MLLNLARSSYEFTTDLPVALQQTVEVECKAASSDNGVVALSLDVVAEGGAWRARARARGVAIGGQGKADVHLSIDGAAKVGEDPVSLVSLERL